MRIESLDKVSELLFKRKYAKLIVSEALRLDQVISFIEREEGERIIKDIDNMGLIGEHIKSPLHKTGATIIDCPACCWYAYKAKEGEK